MKTLASLKKGETGIIKQIHDSMITPKLLDMGCLPGEKIKVQYFAPMGDPMCVHISGYDLVLRLNEADKIELE